MPCYDPRGRGEVRTEYVNGVDPYPLKSTIVGLREEISKLEGGLCAIITELEIRNIASEVISQASKSGLIDLMSFWEEHKKDDKTRLAKELHKFSEHEQAVLKELLNKK